MPVIDLDRRISSFDEVETGFGEEQARKEALRCVDCSVCCECRVCEAACQSGAICHEQEDRIIEIGGEQSFSAPVVIWLSKFLKSSAMEGIVMSSQPWNMSGYCQLRGRIPTCTETK